MSLIIRRHVIRRPPPPPNSLSLSLSHHVYLSLFVSVSVRSSLFHQHVSIMPTNVTTEYTEIDRIPTKRNINIEGKLGEKTKER